MHLYHHTTSQCHAVYISVNSSVSSEILFDLAFNLVWKNGAFALKKVKLYVNNVTAAFLANWVNLT